jgi:hypothetical protein
VSPQLCPDVKMERTLEQRGNVKFCVKLQKSPCETLEMLKTVYGASTMSKSNVFNWHKRFREDREDMNNDGRQGAPVTKRRENQGTCTIRPPVNLQDDSC